MARVLEMSRPSSAPTFLWHWMKKACFEKGETNAELQYWQQLLPAGHGPGATNYVIRV